MRSLISFQLQAPPSFILHFCWIPSRFSSDSEASSDLHGHQIYQLSKALWKIQRTNESSKGLGFLRETILKTFDLFSFFGKLIFGWEYFFGGIIFEEESFLGITILG